MARVDTMGSRLGLRRGEDVLAEQLRDPDVRAEWERLAPARAIALRLVEYRSERGLTQTALGRALAMPQPAVARLESGDHAPSVEMLVRIAEALGIQLLVAVTPSHGAAPWVARPDGAKVIEEVTTEQGGRLLIAAS